MDGSNNLVLDTNIILYATINEDERAIDLLMRSNVFISEITEIELLGFSHISEEEYQLLKTVIETFNVVSMNGVIKNKAIELRRKYNSKTPDAIIAATASELEYVLITADKKLQSMNDVNVVKFEVPK